MDTDSVKSRFVRQLCSNDPVTRKKSVRKLRKWLQSRNTAPLSKSEYLKLWKGLYYCFWQSDKPLFQEELAESISSLFSVLQGQSGLYFFSTFGETMHREWHGLDNWRVDKFLLLIRRIIRGSFRFLKSENWSLANEYSDLMISSFMSPKKLKRVSIGVQLHVADVFLEELSKIGGNDKKLPGLDLLKPFIFEISTGKDDRVADQIEESVFKHLIRQSEVGVLYENSKEMGSDGEDDETSESEEIPEEENPPLDPRAGKIDVVLPEIKINYSELSMNLFSVGSDKIISQNRRKRLYKFSKYFESLSKGDYPLKFDGDTIEAKLERIEENKKYSTKKVAISKMKEDLKLFEQNQLEKDEMKRNGNGSIDHSVDEEDLDDVDEEELDDEQGELDDDEQELDGNEEELDDDEQELIDDEQELDDDEQELIDDEQELDDDEQELDDDEQELDDDEQELDDDEQELDDNEETLEIPEEKPTRINSLHNKIKPNKLKRKFSESPESSSAKRAPIFPTESNWEDSPATSSSSIKAHVGTPPAVFLKKSKSNRESITSTSKKVNFVMTKNKKQSLKEHSKSILASPEIPFNALKKPKQGVLKVKEITPTVSPSLPNPKVVKKNTLLNAKTRVTKIMKRKKKGKF